MAAVCCEAQSLPTEQQMCPLAAFCFIYLFIYLAVEDGVRKRVTEAKEGALEFRREK